MLGRSPLPDSPSSLYPIHINTNPTPTQYQHPLTARPLPYDPPATYHHKRGSSMDPGAVDFRAFYPYTPNEVKHRKRTTPAQLKTLENIFRRDTKPNGPLRVELAANLNMSPRGVQVRFTLFFFLSLSQLTLPVMYLGLVSKPVRRSRFLLAFFNLLIIQTSGARRKRTGLARQPRQQTYLKVTT
jgi:hypothetical protein